MKRYVIHPASHDGTPAIKMCHDAEVYELEYAAERLAEALEKLRTGISIAIERKDFGDFFGSELDRVSSNALTAYRKVVPLGT